MKKGINTFLILLIGILIITAITNPSEDQFINYLETQVSQKTNTKVEKFLNELLGKPILKTTTERKDYIFFSKFVVSTPKDKVTYIGVLKKIFIKLK